MQNNQFLSKMNNYSTHIEDKNFNDLTDIANIVGSFFEDLDSQWVSDKLLDSLTYDDNLQLGNQKASKVNEDILTTKIPEISDTFLEAILNDQDSSIPSLACSITAPLDMSCISGPSDDQFQKNNSDSLVDPGFSLLDDILDALEQDTLFFESNREHSPNNQDEGFSPNNLKDERISEILPYSQHPSSSGKRLSIERDDLFSGERSLSSHEKKKEEILSSPGEQKQSIVDDVQTICDKPIAQPEPRGDTPNKSPNLPVSRPIIKRKTRHTSKQRNYTLRKIPSRGITKRKTELKRPKTKSKRLRSLVSKEYKTTPLKDESQKENIPVSITERKRLMVTAAEIHREPQPVVKRKTRYFSKIRKDSLRMIPSIEITKRKTEIKRPKMKSKRLRTLVSEEYKTALPKDKSKENIIPVSITEEKRLLAATAAIHPEPQPSVKKETRYTSKLRKNTSRMIPRTVITKRKTGIKRQKTKSKQLRTLVSKDYNTRSSKDESQEENVAVSLTKEKLLTVAAAEICRKPYHRSERELVNLSTFQPVVKIRTLSPSTLRESALHLKPGNTTTKRKVKRKNSTKHTVMNCQINATQCCLMDPLSESAKLHDKSEDKKDLSRDSPHNRAAVLDVKGSHSAKTTLQNKAETTSMLHDPSKMINSTQRNCKKTNSTIKPKTESTKGKAIECTQNNILTSLLDPTHQKIYV